MTTKSLLFEVRFIPSKNDEIARYTNIKNCRKCYENIGKQNYGTTNEVIKNSCEMNNKFYIKDGTIIGVNWAAFNFDAGKRHRIARRLERDDSTGERTCKSEVKANMDTNEQLVEWPENEKLEIWLQKISTILKSGKRKRD